MGSLELAGPARQIVANHARPATTLQPWLTGGVLHRVSASREHTALIPPRSPLVVLDALVMRADICSETMPMRNINSEKMKERGAHVSEARHNVLIVTAV